VSGTFLTGVGPAKDYTPSAGHDAFGAGNFDPKTKLKLRSRLSGIYVSLVTRDGQVVHPRLIAAPAHSAWHVYFELPSGAAKAYTMAKARAATITFGDRPRSIPVSPTDSFAFAPKPPPDGDVFFPATVNDQPPLDASAQVQQPDAPDATFDPNAGIGPGSASPPVNPGPTTPPPPPPPARSVLFITSRTATPGAAFDATRIPVPGALDFASLTDADKLCATLASAAGRPETNWRALLAGDHDGIRTRLPVLDGDVVDVAGTLLAHGDDLWAQPTALASLDETGQSVAGPSNAIANTVPVWTGAAVDGTASGNSCKGWTSRAAGDQGSTGDALSKTAWLGGQALESCAAAKRLLCLSLP
jgi:hypothetical protein